MSKSMGQAIDAATAEFSERFPTSDIEEVTVKEDEVRSTVWRVQVVAGDRSNPLTYLVSQIDLAVTLID